MCAVADRRQRFPPRTVHEQGIFRWRKPGGVDIFRFHIIRFPQQPLPIKIDQRIGEAPFVGIGAGHQPGSGFLFRLPQPRCFIQRRHGGDIGKYVDIPVQCLDAERSMHIRPGFHHDQIQFFLVQHLQIVRIEMNSRIKLLHRLGLKKLRFAPQQRIDIAGCDKFRAFEIILCQAGHVAAAMTQPDYSESDFFHFHLPDIEN